MNSWNELLRPLQTAWLQLPNSRRIGLAAALLVSGTLVYGVLYWATSPEFVTLANQLSPTQSAELIALLEAESIPYQLNYSGSTLSVPRGQLNNARLAAGELLDASTSSVESALNQNPWDPPALQADRMLRQQESRLARSIARMNGIRSATVHIGRAEPTPFVRDSSPTTASIILELQTGWQVGAQQATSIISLVAHGVDGLQLENVTLLDTNGRLLSSQVGTQASVSAQLEYKSRLEMNLVAKTESMLEQMLGPGRATVRVTADVDFTDIKRTETRFDPEGKAKKNETVTTISQMGNPRMTAGGAPGTASNLSQDPASSPPDDTYKEEHSTTDYENAKIDETIHELPGKLRRLTVAAIVDLQSPEGDTTVKLPPLADVEAIIKQAVGYDASRQDQIQVMAAAMQATDVGEREALGISSWQRYSEIARTSSLGVGGLAAVVIAWLVLRRLKPIVVESKTSDALSVEQLQHLIQVARLARENPAIAAQIIKSSLNSTRQEDAPAEIRPFRKSA